MFGENFVFTLNSSYGVFEECYESIFTAFAECFVSVF